MISRRYFSEVDDGDVVVKIFELREQFVTLTVWRFRPIVRESLPCGYIDCREPATIEIEYPSGSGCCRVCDRHYDELRRTSPYYPEADEIRGLASKQA